MTVVALLAAACVLGGCGGGGERLHDGVPARPILLGLELPGLDGDLLPKRYTCDGAAVSPPLRWAGVPSNAVELVLLVTDPDAPGGRFVHWTLYALDPSVRSIAAGERPLGLLEGKNSFGKVGYGAPCPPKGDEPHRYEFDLYFLRRRTKLYSGAPPASVRDALAHAGGRGHLVLRYGR